MSSRRKSARISNLPDKVYTSASIEIQERFPVRRKTVRSKRATKKSSPRARLGKRQSTLTQLDFSRLPIPDSDDEDGFLVVGDSQEEEIGNDEDIERPRKKRKSSPAVGPPSSWLQPTMTQILPHKSQEGMERPVKQPTLSEYAPTASWLQPTLTQTYRRPGPGTSDEGDVPGVELSSEDYRDPSEGEETVRFARLDDWVDSQRAAAERPVDHPEVATSLMNPPLTDGSAASVVVEGPVANSPARQASVALPRLTTPRRVHLFEVPSSQSPPDTPLSTQSPLRPEQESSPLPGKYRNSHAVRPAAQKQGSERSPLKERSINIQRVQASPQKVANCLSPLRQKLENARLPQKLGQTSTHPEVLVANEPAISHSVEESPTKKRVREFNERYAALTTSRRSSSGLSASRLHETVQKKTAISVGWSPYDANNTFLGETTHQTDTQFGIGEETQAAFVAIDLDEAALATVQGAGPEPGQSRDTTPKPDRPSASLTGGEAMPAFLGSTSVEMHDFGATPCKPSITSINVVRLETPIKDEPMSIHGHQERIDEWQQRETGTEGAEEAEEDEERVPSSLNEQDEAFDLRASLPHPHIKEQPGQPSHRAIQDSQEPEELEESQEPELRGLSADGTEHLKKSVDDPFSSANSIAEHAIGEPSQDPASEQLLRETQAFVSRVPSSLAVAPPSPARHTPQQPIIQTVHVPRTSQATTVDETQASSALRTQYQLPGSPVHPTQTILIPSSPVPGPPEPSSPISVNTPSTSRFLRRKPVTMSQLLPESLMADGSIPLPPGWTQDDDEEDDEL